MESRPPLHFSVVAIEKKTCGSSLTKVANFTYLRYLYIYVYIYIYVGYKNVNKRTLLLLLLHNTLRIPFANGVRLLAERSET